MSGGARKGSGRKPLVGWTKVGFKLKESTFESLRMAAARADKTQSTFLNDLLEKEINDFRLTLDLAPKGEVASHSHEMKTPKKTYKTKLYRMKIETFLKRLLSAKYGNRVRQWLNGQLSACVIDGWIEFSRLS
jgi:hypothetical protein